MDRGSLATGCRGSTHRDAAAPYVGPGQVAWFQFTIQAPMAPGYYRLYLRRSSRRERGWRTTASSGW